MDYRELLELAAKAAGKNIRIYDGIMVGDGATFVCMDERGFKWNPLIDDDDVFRLAVQLEITPTAGADKCSATWWKRPEMIELDSVVELTNGDPYVATRRAIVLAAAEIEKQSA
jgi:hypothetical protein